MPSSLIVVALVVAWLVVLVPMVVRKRQEIARTADSALAARVVRSGASHDLGDAFADSDDEDAHDHEEAEDTREDFAMSDADEVDTELDELDADELDDTPPARRYRPGRGGYDPEAAARAARAKYGFRQRVVLLMIVLAVITAIGAAVVWPSMWWAHGAIDVALVGYLTYLRRQVRIEEEIRQRRYARMQAVHRSHARPIDDEYEDEYDEEPPARGYAMAVHPGAVVIDIDDEDPWFDHLGHPDDLPYRRAVGE
ncbi:MAG TPA: gephyrin-like molybdotransferase receptor GlpR [Actinokineospora sp.]|nr:gephyrin-like molybdotransferase receptor GlpR [Actinokineospora sp.]